jgi:hypothetical protein
MLIQSKIIDAAKVIVSGSLVSGSITNWHIYGQFDQLDQSGIEYPCVKILCMEEMPLHPFQKNGLRQSELTLQTYAVRVVGDDNQGTTANEFETVSDLVFNPFLTDNIETTLNDLSGSQLHFNQVSENGSETTPLTDGYYASQKLTVGCSRQN